MGIKETSSLKHYGSAVLLSLLALTLPSCVTGVPPTKVAEVYYNLGNAYFELNNFNSAVNAYLHAIELDQSMVSASYNLARVYIESKQIDKGMDLLNDLLEDDPENSVLLGTLGWALFLTDDLSGSLDVYKGILERIEDDDNALYNAAVLSLKLEHKEEALSYFSKLYDLKQDPMLLFRIGSLSLELEKIADAISYLAAYKEKNPEHFETLLALGRAYAIDELYFESLSAYDAALTIEEGDRNALFEKAEILLKYVEDEENGLASFNSAVENGFKNKERLQELINYPDLIGLDEIVKTIESKGLLDEEVDGEESESFNEAPGEPLAPLVP